MMNLLASFIPAQASHFAADIDRLYFFLIGVSMFFTILIGMLVIYFVIRFRRRSDADRPAPTKDIVALEIGWTIIPLVLVIIMFVWGAALFYKQWRPPADAMEILVTGKKWMWKMQHPSGRSEINDLTVPVGRPIRLTMTSEDVIHSFFVPAFRTKADVVPGRYTSSWFLPTEKGSFHLFCAEYCGAEHSLMKGWVHVVSEEEYEAWARGDDTDVAMLTPVEAGQRLFNELGCVVCHNPASGAMGPHLAGLFGSEVRLNTGRTVIADEEYIRESILEPMAKITEGYQPIMPTYKGQVSETQVMHLIAYIRSLSKE